MGESIDEEDIKVEEVLPMEAAFYVEPGKAIQDRGCTSPVMGEKTWESWWPILEKKGILDHVTFDKGKKTFKFGNGEFIKATREATFPVKLFNEDKEVEVSLIPGTAGIYDCETTGRSC